MNLGTDGVFGAGTEIRRRVLNITADAVFRGVKYLPYIAQFGVLYGQVGLAEKAVRTLGIPTTLYDIGETIGFTNFGKTDRYRKQFGRYRRVTHRGLRYKYRTIK